tara:strand:- start:95 stop:412 length:318 start_codon:yes stop_codon:yes gene_type:complete
MKKYLSLIFIVFASCNHSSDFKPEDTKVSRSADMQEEINKLLAKDKANKLLELEYLEQIRIAQENNDTEAFEFFFQEYAEVERLKLPKWIKEEPNYFQGGLKVKY